MRREDGSSLNRGAVRRKRYLAGAAVIGFMLVLLYMTLRFTSTPLGDDRDEHAAATRACHRAIKESLAGARFPFAANVTDLQGGQVQLSGSVDSGSGLQAERRNYSCFLTYHSSAGEYVADSIDVWKSH